MSVLGDRVLDLEAFPTPGHASHHVSFLARDGSCFTGDAAGVRIPPGRYVAPVAPPPDIDVEAWEGTLDAIEERRPERLLLGHFGVVDDPPFHLAELRSALCERGRSGRATARRRTSCAQPRPSGRGGRPGHRGALPAGRAFLAVVRRPSPLLGQEGGDGGRTSRTAPWIRYRARMRRPGVSTLLLVLAVLVLVAPAPASALRLVRVAGNFDDPVHATASPRDGSLHVVEQEGQIWRIGGGDRTLFLDIRGLVAFGGERGLFSIAFPNNYAQTRFFYVNYTTTAATSASPFPGECALRRAVRSTRRMLIDVEHSRHSNHNGGQVAFGPNGRLYLSVGDGGGGCDPSGTPRISRAARASCSASPRQVSERAGASTATACATSGASRSTARRDGCTSPTWARATGRRSTPCGPAPGRHARELHVGPATRDARAPAVRRGGLRGPGGHVFPKDVYSHAQGCSVTGRPRLPRADAPVARPRLVLLRRLLLWPDLAAEGQRRRQAGAPGAGLS